MTTSPTIRRIVLPESGRPRPAPRPATVPIIIECEPDGYLRVYGPPGIRPVVLNRLDDEDDPVVRSLADQYAEAELPRGHRPVYRGDCVRATGLVRRRSVEGECERLHWLELLRTLREAGEELRAGVHGAHGAHAQGCP